MNKVKKVLFLMLTTSIMLGTMYGIFGAYLPSKFVKDVPGMERLLSDNGYTNIKLKSTVDVYFFGDAAEFTATDRNGTDRNVQIKFIKGIYSIDY